MTGLFLNQNVGDSITVDLDVWFWQFVRPLEEVPPDVKAGITLLSVRNRLERLENKLDFEIPAYYRRSSKGHVHVKLKLREDITVLDAFMIRAWMLDDQTRLELDLSRYLLTGSLHEINRCFDEKATCAGILKSGPWISLDTNRNQFTGNIKKDFEDFLKWYKETEHPKEQNGQTQLEGR